jgi:hypothetical protein
LNPFFIPLLPMGRGGFCRFALAFLRTGRFSAEETESWGRKNGKFWKNFAGNYCNNFQNMVI